MNISSFINFFYIQIDNTQVLAFKSICHVIKPVCIRLGCSEKFSRNYYILKLLRRNKNSVKRFNIMFILIEYLWFIIFCNTSIIYKCENNNSILIAIFRELQGSLILWWHLASRLKKKFSEQNLKHFFLFLFHYGV